MSDQVVVDLALPGHHVRGQCCRRDVYYIGLVGADPAEGLPSLDRLFLTARPICAARGRAAHCNAPTSRRPLPAGAAGGQELTRGISLSGALTKLKASETLKISLISCQEHGLADDSRSSD